MNGSLSVASFIKTNRLFTVDRSVIIYVAATLNAVKLGRGSLQRFANSSVDIANANKFGHIRRINGILGLHVPLLVTPMELLGDLYEA